MISLDGPNRLCESQQMNGLDSELDMRASMVDDVCKKNWKEAKPTEASRMKRLRPYGDPRINPHSLTERMGDPMLPHEIGVNKYSGSSDMCHTQEDRISRPSNNESHWQTSHNGYQMPNTVPSHPLHEDQGIHGRRSYHQVRVVNSNTAPSNFEKQNSREAGQPEEDMDIGYEDTPPPLTFDGLERKFNDEILRLVKEQSDMEDAEITRHKERLMEINNQYQQQLLTVRTRQSEQRRELLQKESDTLRYQYQMPGIQEKPFITSSVSASVAAGGVAHQYNHLASSVDATRPYGNISGETARGYRDPNSQIESLYNERGYRDPNNQIESSYSYSERGYRGSLKTSDASGRVPYPEGRVYNTSSRYH